MSRKGTTADGLGGHMVDESTRGLLREAEAAMQRIREGISPTVEELAEAPHLEFWSVVTDGETFALQGVVTGHPNLQDGLIITTSQLLWVAEDRKSARTVSRFYRLGGRFSAETFFD